MLECKFVTSRAKARQLLAKEECRDFRIVNENLSIIMLRPKTIVHRYPRVCGMSILDISKRHFYNMYYNHLKKGFQDKTENIVHDTDGLVMLFHGTTDELYECMYKERKWLDFSKLPVDDRFFQKFPHPPDLRTWNAGTTGLFKIETYNIAEVCALKSKQYSILFNKKTPEGEFVADTKSKGTLTHEVKHHLFVDTVKNKRMPSLNVQMIRSYNYKLYNICVSKFAFHCLNFSRLFVSDNQSFAYGYHATPTNIEREEDASDAQ